MEGLQPDCENSVLLSLPKETLVCVIGQLCAKIRLLKSQLADAEKRNRFLQHDLPRLIQSSISSVVLSTRGELLPPPAEHRRPSECEDSGGECNGSGAEVDRRIPSPPRPTSSPATSSPPSVDIPRIPQLPYPAPADGDLSGPSQADTNAFQLQSAVILNLLSSLLNPPPPTGNFQEISNARRKRKIAPQKMPSSSQAGSSDAEIPAAEESTATTKVDSANHPSPTSLQRPEDADSFKSFLLDPIPLTPLCWPPVPPASTLQSSEPLPSPRKPDPLPSMRLRSAKVVQEEEDNEEVETTAAAQGMVKLEVNVKSEDPAAGDAETEEVSDETLNEVEADITSSTSLRKRRYWQLYLESNGWTRATCALMSCLFSRHQMANSTVFGRQSVCGKIRSRLPAKLVHFIVSRISRRFGVLPSKVRAKMAQKCKDVRRVARKSTDESLPQLTPLNSFCLPSTTTST